MEFSCGAIVADIDSPFHFVAVIGLLILLEGLLSADNALVMAILVRHLPKDQRQKALLYGLAGAFILRFAAILLATQILKFWYLQLLGALYLFWLPIRHFFHVQGAKRRPTNPPKQLGFWPTVALVELTDLAFAIDSVLVAVSVTKVLWVIVTGALIGVVLLRFAAIWLIRILDRWPGLEHMAYVLVGWVAVKLFMLAAHTFSVNYRLTYVVQEMDKIVFWAVTAVIIAGGILLANRGKTKTTAETIESQQESST